MFSNRQGSIFLNTGEPLQKKPNKQICFWVYYSNNPLWTSEIMYCSLLKVCHQCGGVWLLAVYECCELCIKAARSKQFYYFGGNFMKTFQFKVETHRTVVVFLCLPQCWHSLTLISLCSSPVSMIQFWKMKRLYSPCLNRLSHFYSYNSQPQWLNFEKQVANGSNLSLIKV